MFRPEHLARVEKRELFLGVCVEDALFVRLVTVAMEASQRQILQSIVAAFGGGQDVVNVVKGRVANARPYDSIRKGRRRAAGLARV